MKKKSEREIAGQVTVRILMSIAGLAEPEYDLEEFAFLPGQIVKLHPALAQAWIAGGHAEAVDAPMSLGKEYAVREPPERRKT